MRSSRKCLLLLDLVDSTKVAERLGNLKSAQLFFFHDRLVRSEINKWHGTEIDKTDGFLVIFDHVGQALNFAIRYNSKITPQVGIRARIGIHYGEVILKENHTYDVARGAKPLELESVHKAIGARVMSLAGGSQILISSVARNVYERNPYPKLPEVVAIKQVGVYKLKGVSKPMVVSAVGVDTPTTFVFHTPVGHSKAVLLKKGTPFSDWGLKEYSGALIELFLVVDLFCLALLFIGGLQSRFLGDILESGTGIPFDYLRETLKELIQIMGNFFSWLTL